jgi:hypothetical protein
MPYAKKLDALLSPAERQVFRSLSTPHKIQSFLDSLPSNVLRSHEHTMRSPRQVLKAGKAHCLEGAMFAAAALAYHGRPPLLMDYVTTEDDLDHVVAVFVVGGHLGAISKTNYPVNRWRDPVYKTPRELAMSYFHEYFLEKNGKKTLRSYSAPFDIQKFDPAKWFVAEGDVDWLAEALGEAPHYPIASPTALRSLRKASAIEVRMTQLREWTRGGKRLF